MKRLTTKSCVAIMAIVLVLATLAALLWGLATTPGARWFLTTIPSWGGVGFSAQKIEGRMIDHLLLTEVQVRVEQQVVEMERVELRWQPLLLLAGKVAIQELTLNAVQIQDDSPAVEKPPEFAWPQLTGNARRLAGKIEQLRVTNFRYRRLQQDPVVIDTIAASLHWQDRLLSLRELKVVSPAGQISGSFAAGFEPPSLTADLVIAPLRPLAAMDQFSVQLRRSPSQAGESFVGAITVAGSARSRKILELGGEIGMDRKALTLRQFRLTRPGEKGLVTADGSLGLSPGDPTLTLQIQVAGLDLSPELKVPTDLSGTLTFTGTRDKYQGHFTLTNQGQGWRGATLSSAYQGTMTGITLAPFTGELLDGSLDGRLEMTWRDGFALQGVINGQKLNPARIHPDWQGLANFTVSGKVAQVGEGPLTGSINGALRESRLHGQALQGALQANFSDNTLILSKLELQGKGFELHAAGNLAERLTLTAQISDATRLLPNAAGTLQAEGWVRWRDGQLSGAVAGTGRRLDYSGTRIGGAELAARLDPGQDFPLHLAAALRDVSSAGYELSAVTVAADGTLPAHTISVALHAATAEVRLGLSSGYSAGRWQGKITRLAGKDNSGPWTLAAPATFVVSAEKVSVSPLALTAGERERFEVAVELALQPLRGEVRAKFSAVELGRLNSWLSADRKVTGRISGRADGVFHPEQNFAVDGNAVLSQGRFQQKNPDGEVDLTFPAAELAWEWRDETLAGNLALTLAEYGELRSDFQIPLPARFPVAIKPQGPLRATLTGKFQEKGLLGLLFPGLIQKSFGELDAAIVLNGSWEVPEIGGSLRLSKAGAYLPTAGIQLQSVEVSARLDKNRIRIESFRALSGSGHLEGTALVTLAGWRVVSYQGNISGENFQTIYHPELRIFSTPKLSFEGTLEKLLVRGELRLPELHFVAAPSYAVVEPSSDVIREGVIAPVKATSPLALDVQIRVVLGEKVFVKVAGIDAQLAGAVDLSFQRLDQITSAGEIYVVKGRYRTYGVNLEIVRGRLFFAGGPINRPTLDFLALRTIGDVRAGVTVTGTIQRPLAKLYSEPAMSDVDILAYIVLGHPLGNSGEQANLMAQAAGALLTTKQGEVLREQLKGRFGLSTLEIQDGVGGTSSPMGYKPLSVSAPGTIPSTQQAGVTDTILTVGKYLTPKIYISYGKSLITGNNLFRLRYDIFKQWQIESETGGESGVDLFYKLEFK